MHSNILVQAHKEFEVAAFSQDQNAIWLDWPWPNQLESVVQCACTAPDIEQVVLLVP